MIYTHTAAAVAGLVLGGVLAWNVQAWRLGDELSDLKAAHATALADAVQKARQTEKELQDAADQAQKEADALRVERDAAAARAAAAAQRLRNAIGATGACEAARTADERRAADAATSLRAELLGQLDAMAGEISRFADDAHQAGLTCQSLYERARGKPQ